MTDEPRATVFVCVDCKARGNAEAPRSCVTCRVGMCAHLSEGVDALAATGADHLPPIDRCSFHRIFRDLGIPLEL